MGTIGIVSERHQCHIWFSVSIIWPFGLIVLTPHSLTKDINKYSKLGMDEKNWSVKNSWKKKNYFKIKVPNRNKNVFTAWHRRRTSTKKTIYWSIKKPRKLIWSEKLIIKYTIKNFFNLQRTMYIYMNVQVTIVIFWGKSQNYENKVVLVAIWALYYQPI